MLWLNHPVATSATAPAGDYLAVRRLGMERKGPRCGRDKRDRSRVAQSCGRDKRDRSRWCALAENGYAGGVAVEVVLAQSCCEFRVDVAE